MTHCWAGLLDVHQRLAASPIQHGLRMMFVYVFKFGLIQALRGSWVNAHHACLHVINCLLKGCSAAF